MNAELEALEASVRAKLEKKAQPRWTEPMLATLTHEPFSDPGWIFERKLDGVRSLVFRSGEEIRLVSRTRHEMNATFPELVEELAGFGGRDFIADGELVAFDGQRTSFQRLQQRLGLEDPEEARATGVAVYLYLFDLLHWDGQDLTELPLRNRKQILRAAFSFAGHLRFTPHRNEQGVRYLEDACQRGWEGLIAKRGSSTYQHRRSKDWLKLKCIHRQELVIGGFSDPKGSRAGFGALLVGYFEGRSLRYAGKVGTGFDDTLLESLSERLSQIERATCPFEDEPRVTSSHWVTPKLVAEIAFTEWTDSGKLRHPRFLGLRTDKKARDVTREEPSSIPDDVGAAR